MSNFGNYLRGITPEFGNCVISRIWEIFHITMLGIKLQFISRSWYTKVERYNPNLGIVHMK